MTDRDRDRLWRLLILALQRGDRIAYLNLVLRCWEADVRHTP
jgi:hypothetical protein